jgi:hypothetical protein
MPPNRGHPGRGAWRARQPWRRSGLPTSPGLEAGRGAAGAAAATPGPESARDARSSAAGRPPPHTTNSPPASPPTRGPTQRPWGDGASGKANRDQHQQVIAAGKGMLEAGREPSFGGAAGRGGVGGKNRRDDGAQALGQQESADRLNPILAPRSGGWPPGALPWPRAPGSGAGSIGGQPAAPGLGTSRPQ